MDTLQRVCCAGGFLFGACWTKEKSHSMTEEPTDPDSSPETESKLDSDSESQPANQSAGSESSHQSEGFVDEASEESVSDVDPAKTVPPESSASGHGPHIQINNVLHGSDAERRDFPEDEFPSTAKLSGMPLEFQDIPIPADLNQYVTELTKRRVLFVACDNDDEAVLHAAGYRVVESKEFEAYEARRLEGDMLGKVKFADLLTNKSVIYGADGDKSRPAIVLVVINDPGFLEQVLRNFPTVRSQQTWLIKEKIALVCLVSQDTIELMGKFPPENEKRLLHWPLTTSLPTVIDAGQADSSASEAISDLPEPDYEEIIECGKAPEQAAVFVAAFFKRVARGDFSNLMDLLLKDQEEEEVREVEEAVKKGKKPKIRHETFPVPATNRWRKEKSKIRKKLGITITGQGASRSMGFARKGVAEEVRELFWDEGELVVQLYQRLDRARLLFEDDLSPRLQRRLLVVAAEMAKVEPGDFGDKWLHDIVMDFMRELAGKVGNPGEGRDLFEVIWAAAVSRELRLWFFGRLGNLCRALYRFPTTRDSVERFLNRLAERRHFDAVRRVANQLRETPDFEHFKWVRRLLRDDVPRDVKGPVLQQLVDLSSNSPNECQQILRHLCEWLPPRDAEHKSNVTQDYMMVFLVFLTNNASKAFVRRKKAGDAVSFVLLNLKRPSGSSRGFVRSNSHFV